MSSYRALLVQRAQLDADIAAARAAERRGALQQIRAMMAEHGITTAELEGRRVALRGNRVAPVPKYRDPVTGATWSGRGKAPRWLAEMDRERFRIAPATAAGAGIGKTGDPTGPLSDEVLGADVAGTHSN